MRIESEHSIYRLNHMKIAVRYLHQNIQEQNQFHLLCGNKESALDIDALVEECVQNARYQNRLPQKLIIIV